VNYLKVLLLFFLAWMLPMVACTQDDDGPIDVTNSGEIFGGEGFFLAATLDSGSMIHLTSDTLYIGLDSIWSFSNCALKSIYVDVDAKDTVLELRPVIQYQTTAKDCAAPMFRPDTVLKSVPTKEAWYGISQINIYNDLDSLLDTILVRRGSFSLDTFKLYVDSLYDSVKALPLRTKGSPSLLKVLDSLTPRTYYWRSMKSSCKFFVDKCAKTVPDTLFPRYWILGDTALVPVRQRCADSTYTYCKSAGWEDDSLALGEVQERLDTLWHTHLYYVESIPECGAMNRFQPSAYGTLREMNIIRELYTPNQMESFCGPSTQKDMFWYDLSRGYMVPDSVSMDSLRGVWKKATVSAAKPKSRH
jgi:hypothetical protein